MKPLIVADNAIPYLKGVFEPWADVRYLPAAAITAQEVKEADVLIIRTRTRCNERLLADSKVGFIATATIGFDHIDTSFCQQHNIIWRNSPGCNAGGVQQYIMSAIATYTKKYQLQLNQLTLGIVGVGHVGKRVEVMAKLLGMRVLLNDPPRAEEETAFCSIPLSAIAAESDVITFHTPLTTDGLFPTKYLADETFFSSLACCPLVINAARGGIVDEQALLQAYDNGKVSDFVLDCWENEPHLNAETLEKALLATPHIAGYSADGKANATQQCVRNVAEYLGIESLKDYRVTALEQLSPVTICPDDYLNQQLAAYPISKDSDVLKLSPDTFEQQRTDYTLRREIEFV